MATSMMQKNFGMVQQQFSTAVGKSSVVVKSIALAVTIGYFISFAKSAIPYIAVTPGYVMPPNFWVWTFLTHSFVELHFWDVLIDVSVVILCGKLLEPLWGAMDMLIFFIVVNTGVAIATSFLYISFYLVTKNEEYLFETYIHGLAGYIAGFSVAVKQVMPDHVLLTSPFGKLRNTHIPLLLLIVALTLRLVGALDGPYPFIFFPNQLQPVVAIISNTIFLGLVKIKVCKKPQRKYDVSSPSTITSPTKWPSLVDDDGNKQDSPTTPEEKSMTDTSKPAPVKLPIPDFKDNVSMINKNESSSET
ncbi:hypothetical protein KUTeg_020350 [Tegillarca granosa]|uniref:Transmembrane protein 115 n=1 Tax=Tegillarca granosa TaxID=220873 RepID=A0ABQ9EDM6_TEGGR|nr:hypothetical protein KUTeg_020350 [Tegillarca granosa]